MQFFGFADAVAICILPYLQFIEACVFGVDDPVAVAVEISKRGEAVCRGFAVIKTDLVAEQFTAIVDQAITVTVEHEQAIFFSDPTTRGSQAIVVA